MISRRAATRPTHSFHPRYRSDIDGLRAVAVLSVVAFHFFPTLLPGGFVGVDIFFVISGYLISLIIFQNLDSQCFSFVEFYARRINRIFPALLLVLIGSAAFGWPNLLADEYKQLGKHIAGGAGFVSNLVLMTEAGYFDVASETKPLLHLWSLGIEEQFYFLWPLLLWIAWRAKIKLHLVIFCAVCFSLFVSLSGITQDTVQAFYLPYTRFWELACGSALAWCELYRREDLKRLKLHLDRILIKTIGCKSLTNDGTVLANCLSLPGLCLIVISFFLINIRVEFPGAWPLLPVIGAALIISGSNQSWINRVLLSNKIAVWIGLISYPLYLWHWPLYSFSRIIEGATPSRSMRVVIFFISILFAWLSYRLLETPLRRIKDHNAKAVGLTVAMVVIGFSGYAIFSLQGLPLREIAKQYRDFQYEAQIKDGYQACDIADLRKNGIDLYYCFRHTINRPNSVIIGDSHAEDKFRGLVEVDIQNNWMLIGHPSCPPVLNIIIEGDAKGCKERFELIFDYVLKNDDIKNVALSFFGNYFKTDAYAADHLRSSVGPDSVRIIAESGLQGDRKTIYFDGLDAAIKLLINHGKNVTLFIDIPELPFFPRDCFRNALTLCTLQKQEVIRRQLELRVLVQRLREANSSLKIFDPIDLFCNTNNCTYTNNGVILYRDSHHLSLRGSKLYAERFVEARKLGPQDVNLR